MLFARKLRIFSNMSDKTPFFYEYAKDNADDHYLRKQCGVEMVLKGPNGVKGHIVSCKEANKIIATILNDKNERDNTVFESLVLERTLPFHGDKFDKKSEYLRVDGPLNTWSVADIIGEWYGFSPMEKVQACIKKEKSAK
jgi:hypothetical protein